MKNRTRIEIYASILQNLDVMSETGLKITRISYGAGIPTDRARKYVELMRDAGLIKLKQEDNSYFIITTHGIKFLEAFHILQGYLDEMNEKSL